MVLITKLIKLTDLTNTLIHYVMFANSKLTATVDKCKDEENKYGNEYEECQ